MCLQSHSKLIEEKLGEESVILDIPSDEKVEPQNEEDQYSVLKYNTAEYVNEITPGDLGNVLLTGATGFLGIHILKELLCGHTNKIFCLVRSTRVSAGERLKSAFFYYFA